VVTRTPTLAEWPYRMVRLACDLCPREGQYRKETQIERFGSDVLMPDARHLIAECPPKDAPGGVWGVLRGSAGVSPPLTRVRINLLTNSILDIEASHLALSKMENVSDRLVLKPVRLPLQQVAFEIPDGLLDLSDDRAIRSSMKGHWLDVRTDHAPLARPVLAYGLAAMDMATIHAVGPDDIIGEHGQDAVDISSVKSIVDAL
jgi:hypothetical protein